VLTSLIVTACGLNAAPQSDGPVPPAAVEPETEMEEVPAPPGELTLVEKPASSEMVSAPVEEKVVIALDEASEEVVLAVEPEVESVAATPMPLPTATFGRDDGEAAMAGAPDMDRAEGAMEPEAELAEAEPVEADDAIIAQQVEPLKAGEVDDNARWDDYLLYRRNYRGPQVHDRDVTERYVIEVEDAQGNPVLGATVRVFLPGQQQRQEIYSARTYASGQVLFHPRALADIPLEQVDRFIVEVQQGNLLEQFSLTRFEAQATSSFTERWTVSLDSLNQADSLDLDVLFLVDATGSMADEIAKIQNTIFDVAARIDGLSGQPNTRYGMVTYRDRGDQFVTRSYEFTPDVGDFHRDLSTVYADGGGDTPESLNEALHDALHGVEWRGGEAVQLIFLIADAPPHLDYPQDYSYADEMEIAARRGIKIFPIASSGLDDQGEYIFRQIAQYTQGRFIFLTYAGPTNGGAPGEVTTHHVEVYSVNNLDDLLVKLVEEELAYQSQPLVQAQ
jgi:hypothetical protein